MFCLWGREGPWLSQGVGIWGLHLVHGKDSLQTPGTGSQTQLSDIPWKSVPEVLSLEGNLVERELKWEWEYDLKADKVLQNSGKLKFLCN